MSDTRQTAPAPEPFRAPRGGDALRHHRRLAGHLVRAAAAARAEGAAGGQGAAVRLSVRRQPLLCPARDDGISFAELRALADALPLLRAVIETRKDQIAGLSYAVRARDRAPRRRRLASDRRRRALSRPPRPAPFVRRLAAHAARGHAGHRRRDDLSALYARRRALLARRHRRRDHHAADRRGRPLARSARPRLSADPARRAGGRLLLRRTPLSAAQRARPSALRHEPGRADRADRQHRAAARRGDARLLPHRLDRPTPSPPCRRNGRSTRSASSRIISTR